MFTFIARLYNLTMNGLAKEFFAKTATATVSQSVLTIVVRTRNTGSDLGNARKRRDSLLHQRPKAYATISVNIVQRNGI